jgi:hypothetical protein
MVAEIRPLTRNLGLHVREWMPEGGLVQSRREECYGREGRGVCGQVGNMDGEERDGKKRREVRRTSDWRDSLVVRGELDDCKEVNFRRRNLGLRVYGIFGAVFVRANLR